MFNDTIPIFHAAFEIDHVLRINHLDINYNQIEKSFRTRYQAMLTYGVSSIAIGLISIGRQSNIPNLKTNLSKWHINASFALKA